MVYLTDSVAWRYALNAAILSDTAPVLLELDVDIERLLPDEDYLAQVECYRSKDTWGNHAAQLAIQAAVTVENMKECRALWQESLAGIGSVAHEGTVDSAHLRQSIVLITPDFVDQLDSLSRLCNGHVPGLDDYRGIHGGQCRVVHQMLFSRRLESRPVPYRINSPVETVFVELTVPACSRRVITVEEGIVVGDHVI